MAARWCVAASALGEPGEAQAGVNGSVEFSPALRGCETFGYVGDGRLEIGGLKGSGDVEFGASAPQIPRQRISGGKPSVNVPNPPGWRGTTSQARRSPDQGAIAADAP